MTFWRRLLSRGESIPPGENARWVVIDTETTGLDVSRDALLAVGGVAVDEGGVRIADSFEAVIRHTGGAEHANIVLHGIGRQAQREGEPPAEALAALVRWIGESRCVGFHSDFDRAVLARAASLAGVALPDRPWLDLALLAPALAVDAQRRGAESLDDWLDEFGIECTIRHNAAADALATAELLLKLRAHASRQGNRGYRALIDVVRQHKWLGVGR